MSEGKKKPIPIGGEFFDPIIDNGSYYVDKTGLISELLETDTKVNLFTRPRRFGKTLMMTTLKCFFEIGTDPARFEGMEISRHPELCAKHMGQYPVIFLTLKGVSGEDFEQAKELMETEIYEAANKHYYLLSSEKLNEGDKEQLKALLKDEIPGKPWLAAWALSASFWRSIGAKRRSC